MSAPKFWQRTATETTLRELTLSAPSLRHGASWVMSRNWNLLPKNKTNWTPSKLGLRNRLLEIWANLQRTRRSLRSILSFSTTWTRSKFISKCLMANLKPAKHRKQWKLWKVQLRPVWSSRLCWLWTRFWRRRAVSLVWRSSEQSGRWCFPCTSEIEVKWVDVRNKSRL